MRIPLPAFAALLALLLASCAGDDFSELIQIESDVVCANTRSEQDPDATVTMWVEGDGPSTSLGSGFASLVVAVSPDHDDALVTYGDMDCVGGNVVLEPPKDGPGPAGQGDLLRVSYANGVPFRVECTGPITAEFPDDADEGACLHMFVDANFEIAADGVFTLRAGVD